MTPSPNQRHQELVARLHLSLGAVLEDRPDKGRLFLSPFDVVFSFHDVVEPDLVFVAPDQLDILTAQNIQGTPALVIEILSPSTRTRDRELKQRLDTRTGVRDNGTLSDAGSDVNRVLAPRSSSVTQMSPPPSARCTASRRPGRGPYYGNAER